MVLPRGRVNSVASWLSLVLATSRASNAFISITAPTASSVGSIRTAATRTMGLSMAAPGVQMDSPAAIEVALNNPRTTIVDARGLDEIAQNGYFNPGGRFQWISAPCTVQECPLLELASDGLIRDKESPVIVYCASGKRSTKAKEVLESKGYKQVLNAGGYPADLSSFMDE